MLTVLALFCFAGNSLLCRLALRDGKIDVYSFTSIRIVSGAAVLWILAHTPLTTLPRLIITRPVSEAPGSWLSAIALFCYAAGFSIAYIRLTAATGALLLFSAVQFSMISHGIWKGERLGRRQVLGLVVAVAGLIALLMPGLAAPPAASAFAMLSAGVAWGVYSLRGKGAGDPIKVTAGNFVRAVPLSVLLSIIMFDQIALEPTGFYSAIASGVITSGLGYAIWYSALPSLSATTAATVQLCVPAIASLGGILFLGETVSVQMVMASVAILGGIALTIRF